MGDFPASSGCSLKDSKFKKTLRKKFEKDVDDLPKMFIVNHIDNNTALQVS